MANFVRLPVSGTVINTEEILFIAHKALNEYVVFVRDFPTGPILDTTEYEILTKAMGVRVLEAPPKVVA